MLYHIVSSQLVKLLSMPTGHSSFLKKVKVKEWSRDDQANNIRVTTPDGKSYYSGSENIMLINEKNEATTQKSAKSSESVKNY